MKTTPNLKTFVSHLQDNGYESAREDIIRNHFDVSRRLPNGAVASCACGASIIAAASKQFFADYRCPLCNTKLDYDGAAEEWIHLVEQHGTKESFLSAVQNKEV
jgi:hypothetical protein